MKKRVALLMLLCKWAQLKQAWRAKKKWQPRTNELPPVKYTLAFKDLCGIILS
jgi:hypothetical protein